MAILTKNKIQSSHWYTPEGEPMHTVPKADGNGERATTIKDAKRLRLLPSVTSIIGILEKPALVTWKLNQVALATLRTPKTDAESPEYWCTRVREAAFEQVEDAADLGSRVHVALEAAVMGAPYDADLSVFVAPVLAMIASEGLSVTACEKRVVNMAHGFAGMTDVFFNGSDMCPGILDYKTKKTKPGEKVIAYDEHRLQLAAYAASEYGEGRIGQVRAINVFVSTTEPGRVEIIKHGDLTPDWEAYKVLAALWRYLKGYDPR